MKGKICVKCGEVHVTETARRIKKTPGLTESTKEWVKKPTIYDNDEVCHHCFIKS